MAIVLTLCLSNDYCTAIYILTPQMLIYSLLWFHIFVVMSHVGGERGVGVGVGGFLCSVVHLQWQYQAVMEAAHLCQRRYGGAGCQMII